MVLCMLSACGTVADEPQTDLSVIGEHKERADSPSANDGPHKNDGRVVVPLANLISPPAAVAEIPSDAEELLQKHCQEEYGEDASMEQYCLTSQREGLAAVRATKPGEYSELALAYMRNECASDYDDDFAMWAYCERSAREDLRKLNAEPPKDVPRAVFEGIRRMCVTQWGADFPMWEHCEADQREGYLKVQAPGPGDLSEAGFKYLRDGCAESRGDDYSGRAWCEKEGIKEYRQTGRIVVR